MGPGVVDFQLGRFTGPLRQLRRHLPQEALGEGLVCSPSPSTRGRCREATEGYGLCRYRACGAATADFTGPRAESVQ